MGICNWRIFFLNISSLGVLILAMSNLYKIKLVTVKAKTYNLHHSQAHSDVLEETISIKKEMLLSYDKGNHSEQMCIDLQWFFYLSGLHASMSRVTEPPHCRGQAFNPVCSLGVLQTCTCPLVENIVKDDSSDHITYFHLSVDQCLWFLHHWARNCTLVFLMRGFFTATLIYYSSVCGLWLISCWQPDDILVITCKTVGLLFFLCTLGHIYKPLCCYFLTCLLHYIYTINA